MSGTEGERDDGRRLDIEAEFAKIVDAYGDAPPEPTPPATQDSLADRFRAHGWMEPAPSDDPMNTAATYYDEGHFVPPEPPPIAMPPPPRLAAWSGVFGAPLVSLLLVVFRVRPPEWLLFLLVVAFVGGFVYLIAHMRRDDDQTLGDDGAVL